MPEGAARILLVDDEQSVQTLLAYPLRKDGFEVVAAHDGRDRSFAASSLMVVAAATLRTPISSRLSTLQR